MRHQSVKRSVFVSVGVLTFIIAGVFGACENTVLASEKTLISNSESDSVDLWIVGDQVYGHFLNRPLFELLDKINSQSKFKYYASQKLLEHQVSGTFDGTSLLGTLKTILQPFNYVIVSGEANEDMQLFLSGMKDNAVEENTVSASFKLPADKDFISSDALAEAKLLDSEFLLLEVSDHTTSSPPEFENSQILKNQQSDPKSNKENDLELPHFEPTVNSTGPVDPSLNTDDLPDFDPYYSENGSSIP